MENMISEIYRKYYDVLFREAMRRVKDANIAEDCVQESFCVLIEKLLESKSGTNEADEVRIYPFLKKVCINSAVKNSNSFSRVHVIDTELLSDECHCPGAEDEFFRERLMSRLDFAIENQLPEYRTVLFYRFGCGMTYGMIGEKLHRTEGSVQKITSRVIHEIKEDLEERDI